MIELNDQQRDILRAAVHSASQRCEVRHAVARLYHDLQVEIEKRRPLCVASGRCCKFEQFGHRLFVTTLELAKLSHDLEQGVWPDELADAQKNWKGPGCPFQIGTLCGVHLIRPFGCRIFFCDETARDWQEQQYALFHERLKSLHSGLKVPYFYVEWRMALKTVFRLPLE